MVNRPLVSIIIPHYLGDILQECLASVYACTRGVPSEVIVADDQPDHDGSLDRARERFPEIRIVPVGGGKGMGAGCNRGLEAARGRYAMLLNNDVQVGEGWLRTLVKEMEKDESIAACQPKVTALTQRARWVCSTPFGRAVVPDV